MQFFQLNLSGKRDTNTCFHCRCFIKGFQKRLCIPVCAFSLKADRITTFRQTLQAVSCLDIAFPLFIQKFPCQKRSRHFTNKKRKQHFCSFFQNLIFFVKTLLTVRLACGFTYYERRLLKDNEHHTEFRPTENGRIHFMARQLFQYYVYFFRLL